MKKVAKYNEVFLENIKTLTLTKNIIGWKKSRGDGNCYFRAVITRYIEIIHKYYKPVGYLESFIKFLQDVLNYSNDEFFVIDEFRDAGNNVLEFLRESLNEKKRNPINAFKLLLSKLQDTSFDLNLVKVARLITYYALMICKNDEKYKHFIVDEFAYIDLINTMNEEAEGLILTFLPIGLGCQVVQYNLFENVNEQLFGNDEQTNIVIHIIRRSGHYDILYTIQEMEYEQYNFEAGSYCFFLDLQNWN